MELGSASLRLDREDVLPGKTTFRLEGRLGSLELNTVRESVEPWLGRGCQIEIDLAALRFLDEPGARLLCALRHRGVHLANADGFVGEMLRILETER